MAEAVGFEPTMRFPARQFSRLEPSTTRPHFQDDPLSLDAAPGLIPPSHSVIYAAVTASTERTPTEAPGPDIRTRHACGTPPSCSPRQGAKTNPDVAHIWLTAPPPCRTAHQTIRPPVRQTGAFAEETSPETALGRRIPLIVMA